MISHNRLMPFILFLTLGFVSHTIYAREIFEFYNGARSLGMGGTNAAVVNDETALLTNPAALSRLRNYFLTLVDPEIHWGAGTGNIIGSDLLGFTTGQSILDSMKGRNNQHLHARFQVFPSFVLPNFGVGLLLKYAYDADIDNTTTMQLDYVNDLAIVFGYAIRIWDGRIKFGFSTKIINRIEVRQDIDTASTTVFEFKDAWTEGNAFAIDAGLIFTMPWKFLPTLSIVAHDIGTTTFNQGTGIFHNTPGQPQPIPQKIDLALAVFPIHGNRQRSALTVEYRDVLGFSDDADKLRRFHFGYEFNFSDLLFLRVGMNQRYWTAGAEFAIENFQFQLATYGEEVGTSTSRRWDRRWVGKAVFRF